MKMVMRVVQCVNCGVDLERRCRNKAWCKSCRRLRQIKRIEAWRLANKERSKIARLLWVKNNPERVAYIKIKSKYKITKEDFNDMLNGQNGRCSVCNCLFDDIKKPNVDHDHSCCPGQQTCGNCVRALLCSLCNTLLGKALDDPDILDKAANYLRQHKEKLNEKRQVETLQSCPNAKTQGQPSCGHPVFGNQ